MQGRGRIRHHSWIGRLCGRFARDSRGSTAVEFAMISVPFLGLLFAIFQTAYLLMTQSAMDNAAALAARNIYTGQAMGAGTTGTGTNNSSTFLTNVVCPSMPSFITCSNLILDVRPAGTSGATSWTTANTDSTQTILNSSSNNFCIGGPGDIVIVRIIYPVPAYLSVMTLSAALSHSGSVTQSTAGQSQYNSNWVYPIMGVLAFQNEPFAANGNYTKATGC